jgi:glycosyltransferase involved in cell wall biosynthesis
VIKVVLLIPTLDRSGAEKQFTLLATNLPRDDFDVHAVALTRGGPYEALLRRGGIPVTILHKRWKFDPIAWWRLRGLVADLQPDILHAWLFAANSYGRMVAGNGPRPKVVVSERCVDTWKRSWQLAIDRRQIRRTTRLVGNSQGVADFYRQQGFPQEKIVVIPNGVEIPEAASVDRNALWAKFEIPPGSSVVGYVGRLARQKRVHDLIWAMQVLRQLRDRVYFVLVGEGPERARLVKLAQHMGCDHLVRFLGHREDAADFIRQMDVVWLASDFEGMSNSIMEAMAAGVPVVASDIPPNRELVVDGETGYLVKVGDGIGFAQFADRLLADGDLAQRLGRAALQRVQTEFSVQKMIDSYTALYREIVEESEAKRQN